jgi:hypothetical protein
MKSGSLNPLEPSGPVQGLLYLFTVIVSLSIGVLSQSLQHPVHNLTAAVLRDTRTDTPSVLTDFILSSCRHLMWHKAAEMRLIFLQSLFIYVHDRWVAFANGQNGDLENAL